MQVFFIGVLFVFMVEILKKLTRAWQIGKENNTTLGMEGKNPIGGENSFLTSCFASLRDGRYAVWDAKSIQCMRIFGRLGI
jgi:hypothetical protein